jgi:hypothetical protein
MALGDESHPGRAVNRIAGRRNRSGRLRAAAPCTGIGAALPGLRGTNSSRCSAQRAQRPRSRSPAPCRTVPARRPPPALVPFAHHLPLDRHAPEQHFRFALRTNPRRCSSRKVLAGACVAARACRRGVDDGPNGRIRRFFVKRPVLMWYNVRVQTSLREHGNARASTGGVLDNLGGAAGAPFSCSFSHLFLSELRGNIILAF